MQRADHNMLTRGAEALGGTLQWTDALDRVHPHGSSENQRFRIFWASASAGNPSFRLCRGELHAEESAAWRPLDGDLESSDL